VSLVRWKTKLQILFSTFREFTAWKTKAVFVMLPLKTEYVLNVVLLVRPGASNGFSNKADGSLCRLQEQNILPVRCPSFIQQTLRWSSLPLVISCSVCCSTHALQCSWISMTAWWQHVCICQECSNYIIGGTLPRRL